MIPVRFTSDLSPGLRVTYYSLNIAVGMRHDPPGKPGLAHLCEHVMYATAVGSEGNQVPLHRAVSDIGGFIDGATFSDYIELFGMVPIERTEELLALLREALTRSIATDYQVVSSQAQVIAREIETVVDTMPYGGFPWIPLMQNAFPRSWALGHNGYGDAAGVATFTPADVRHLLGDGIRRGVSISTVSGKHLHLDENLPDIPDSFPPQHLRHGVEGEPGPPHLGPAPRPATAVGFVGLGIDGNPTDTALDLVLVECLRSPQVLALAIEHGLPPALTAASGLFTALRTLTPEFLIVTVTGDNRWPVESDIVDVISGIAPELPDRTIDDSVRAAADCLDEFASPSSARARIRGCHSLLLNDPSFANNVRARLNSITHSAVRAAMSSLTDRPWASAYTPAGSPSEVPA